MEQRDIGRFVIKVNETGVLRVDTAGASYALMTANVRNIISQSSMFAKLKQCFD